MRLLFTTLGALGALQALGVYAQATPPCFTTCLDAGKNDASLGCAAGDAACQCKVVNFYNSVHDCSVQSSCVQSSQVAGLLNSDYCKAEPISASASASAAPTATATNAASKTAAASKTKATDATTTSSSSKSDASESSSNSASDSSDKDKSDKSKGGLSAGAEVGIGIGVAGGVLAVAGVALWFLLRSRKRKMAAGDDTNNFYNGSNASRLYPDTARAYNSADSASFREKNNYDMGVIANRYEDMVPRTTPRVMV